MLKINLLKNYINYRFKAKTIYDIHSPFVFSLISEITDKKVRFYIFETIEAYRSLFLFQKNDFITINDLGAGSKINCQKKRSIASISKTSLAPQKYCELLFKLANYIGAKNKLEIGTSLGITTSYLACQDKRHPVYTIEGDQSIYNSANKLFNDLNIKNIHSTNAHFDDELKDILNKEIEYDLIYIDGNHTFDATIRYFNLCIQKLSDQGVIIIDDIYWSKEMTKAWNKIKQRKEVTITLDFFKLGMVFKNKAYTKQDFVIKY